jgi:hypothetical protein
VGFPRRPRRRHGGAHRQGASRRERRPSLGLIAAAGGEGATEVVGSMGGRAEGRARQEQKLTGEEVATVRWFRWLGCWRAVKKLLGSFCGMM